MLLAGFLHPLGTYAQIDPSPRKLVQIGYNAPFEGHPPLSAYAFYYWNQPDFPQTNVTLRLAIAPTYLDSELGIRHLLGENTDLGVGVAGGGFADSYDEIRKGQFLPSESFVGHGVESSLSLYHCFNPGELIPLNGVLRGIAHFSFYNRDNDTAKAFEIPDDRGMFSIRTGLRWGGKEPLLYPSLAMELSVWYQGEFRDDSGQYGLTNVIPGGDRKVNSISHLFWGTALLAYTLPKWKHDFYLSLTAGTSIGADRFSAYRLGALLPMGSEFPLSLPGYYYQEISAEQFVLLGGNYIIPIDEKERWNVTMTATTAVVDYLNGLEQPGEWHTGVGAGILYKTSSLKVMVGYAYGVDAIRSDGRGANSLGVLLQLNLDNAREAMFNSDSPNRWRGFQRIFGRFGG